MKLGAIRIAVVVLLIVVGVGAWHVRDRWLSTAKGVSEPNVIVINIDTLRADHLSQYGYRGRTSLVLGDFARHATRFADAVSPAPWTKPSVAALMSGLAPARHGATGRKKPLSLDAVTFAELLEQAGWRTGAFSDNPFVSKATQLDQGFEDFYYKVKSHPSAKARVHDVNSHDTQLYEHAEVMFKKAAEWIMEQKQERFLLYLQPMNVHGPYKVPPPARTALLGRMPISGFHYYQGPMQDIMMRRKFDERARVDDRYLRSQREMYDTSIHYVAGVVADFFAFLEQQGLYDDAMIIVVSDHGEELFDHGGFGHAWTLYEEVLSVPLFIKLPRQREGRVVEQGVSTLDIFPTILQAAGVAIPDDLDGAPLQVYMEPGKSPPSKDLYFSTRWFKRCVARGVREGAWKLIEIERSYEIHKPTVMLFNLERDPQEAHDVSAEHPAIVARLGNKLSEQFSYYEANRVQATPHEVDALDEDALRALGYVE